MLKFIGTGSAFNTDLGNTSAFLKQGSSLVLIDCGGTVFHRLRDLKLLDTAQNIYVVITHMHPDHVGSLGDVVFYTHYALKNKVNIIYPKQEHMENFLLNIGVNKELQHLISSNKVQIEDEALGKIYIDLIPVSHVETIEAYGFVMQQGGKTIYYSGDANTIDAGILSRLKKGEFDTFYQDTCGLDYEGNSHLSLNKLKQLIDKPYRSKVCCMHLDQFIDEEEIYEAGFSKAEALSIKL